MRRFVNEATKLRMGVKLKGYPCKQYIRKVLGKLPKRFLDQGCPKTTAKKREYTSFKKATQDLLLRAERLADFNFDESDQELTSKINDVKKTKKANVPNRPAQTSNQYTRRNYSGGNYRNTNNFNNTSRVQFSQQSRYRQLKEASREKLTNDAEKKKPKTGCSLKSL